MILEKTLNSAYKIILTLYENKYVLLYMQDNRTIEIKLFDKNSKYNVGDIYSAEIKEKADGIDATFVSISKDKKGYLKGTKYKNGSVVPVMIKKRESLNKRDVVTDELVIPGIYNVCFKDKTIKRTNSGFIDEESVNNEKLYLEKLYREVSLYGDKRTKGVLLYKNIDIINTVYSNRFDMLDEIITDDKELYDLFIDFNAKYRELGINIDKKIRFYQDNQVNLFALYNVSSRINDAISKKVWLNSGAYLYIEHTEAMTVIDVNTGNASKKSKEETFLTVNLEAAKEVVHQLRLRNLSGIIIVDFINMKSKNDCESLLEYINEIIKDDNRKAKCHGMTKLGLVEITREKKDNPLFMQLKDIRND